MTEKELRSFLNLAYLVRKTQKEYFEIHKKYSKIKKTYEDAKKAKLDGSQLESLSKMLVESTQEREDCLKKSCALETRFDKNLDYFAKRSKELGQYKIKI